MTKRELLENYRSLVREIDLLEKQSAFLNQYVGGPRPVRSVQLTGMPRGTNEPEAALMQFNAILDAIDDVDDRNILRAYYALNWTDERIGNWLNYDKSTIWRRRNQLMNELSLQLVHISAYGQP